MEKDRLSKEEAGKLLDQRVHFLASTQDLRHLTRNFVKLEGDYLGEESLICLSMGTWPRHIERFECQYDKALEKDTLFGDDLMDRVHKHVQVFLHYCNSTSIKDVESGDLTEFGGLQKKVQKGERLTSTPGWVDRPAPKEEGGQKYDGHWMGARSSGGGGGRDTVLNTGLDPQLWIMERLGETMAAAR